MKHKKRFKENRLCSSDNYELSRRVHKCFIIREHRRNISEIEIITKIIPTTKRAFVKCFEELIPITLEEANRIQTTINIIWK